MRKLAKLPIIVLLLFSSSAMLLAQSKDKVAVEQVIKDQIAAQVAYDRAGLERITTSDYIEISPLGEVDGRAKMLDFYKPEMKPMDLVVKTELKDFTTRVYKDFAVTIVRIDYAMSGRGRPYPPRSIRGTFVTRKEGKKWRVASAHFTGIRPPGAPPVD